VVKKKGKADVLLGASRIEVAAALSIDVKSVSWWFAKRSRPRLYLRQIKALMDLTEKNIEELIEILDPEE
jgi:hypothetical protein